MSRGLFPTRHVNSEISGRFMKYSSGRLKIVIVNIITNIII